MNAHRPMQVVRTFPSLEDPRDGHRQLCKNWLGCFDWLGVCPPWERRSLGIVSSHLHRADFETRRWQLGLQSALRLAREQKLCVFFSGETPFAPIVEHACVRFDLPYTILSIAPPSKSIASNLDEMEMGLRSMLTNQPEQWKGFASTASILDHVVVGISDQLFAIQVKEGGKIAKLLCERMESSCIAASTLKISVLGLSDLSWLNRGAVGWIAEDDSAPLSTEFQSSFNTCHRAPPYTIHPISRLSSWREFPVDRYLVHCTRGRRGAWPDQSSRQYLDSLLIDNGAELASPMQSLAHILSTGYLRATQDRKPGNRASISFSSTPLPELLARRSFQRHLAHWDWEPYGLMFRRNWLRAQGAQPVVYRRRDEIAGLSEDTLALTQVYSDHSKGRDWREEREWRLMNDIRLQSLPPDEGIVFVPSSHEARQLQHISRWPILVVNE